MLLNKELTLKVKQDIISAIKEGVRKWLNAECLPKR